MFWKAITEGLSQMTHWEIWISIFIYGLIFGLFYFTVGYAMLTKEDSKGVQAAGCLTSIVGGPVIQGILVAFTVTALLPILAGGEDFIPFDLISANWWPVTKAGLISIVVTILLTFIPLLGDFISKTPGTAIFVQGAIVFHMLANNVLSEILKQSNSNANIFPGFWVSIGFVILSIIIFYIVFFIVVFILIKLKIIDDYSVEKYSFLIGNFIGLIPGILCLFLYCSYIRLTILEATGN